MTEPINDRSVLLCLPNELVTCILHFAGPNGTASAGITCRKLHKFDLSSNALWFRFAREFFRHGQVGSYEATTCTSWRNVYVCCERVKLESLRSSQEISLSEWDITGVLRMRHMYDSDQDKVFSFGFGVENVLSNNFCWSTSPNICQNVDLVTQIISEGDEIALITSIDVVTPPLSVADCPPKTILAFASSDVDNTEAMLKNSYHFNKVTEKSPKKRPLEENKGTKTGGEITTCVRGWVDEPIARIDIPPIPDCHGQTIRQKIRPMIGRTFLFKILEAYNPNRHRDPNVDIEEIRVHGRIVPGLAALLDGKKEDDH